MRQPPHIHRHWCEFILLTKSSDPLNGRGRDEHRIATDPITGVHNQVANIPRLIHEKIVHVADATIGSFDMEAEHVISSCET